MVRPSDCGTKLYGTGIILVALDYRRTKSIAGARCHWNLVCYLRFFGHVLYTRALISGSVSVESPPQGPAGGPPEAKLM